MEFEQVVMNLISYSGSGRAKCLTALNLAYDGKFDEAWAMIKEANDEINRAHETQTKLIQAEITGKQTEISLLLIHAQDHLMNALTVKDLATSLITYLDKGDTRNV